MVLWRFAVLLALLSVPPGVAWRATASPGQNRKLIVIAINGLDARYLRDADRLRLKIPTLRKLAKQGATADGVVGVRPDDSWASSTTIVTGVLPAQHGVLEPRNAKQMPQSHTLWQAVTETHRKTALLYWPASLEAAVDYNCPQYWDSARAADLPFDSISLKCTPGLVQRISSVYPVFSKTIWNDSTALTGLRYLLQYEQPDLALVNLTDLDQEQEETGALSLYSREVLENEDEMLGQALANCPPHTQIAIVSDHGFETEDFVVRPKVLIKSEKVEVAGGLIGATNTADAAALRKLVGSRKTGIAQEIPLTEVREYLPEAATWTAAFSTMQNYVASSAKTGKPLSLGNHKGVHSFWPKRPNLRSTFILSGDGIRAVHLPEISMLQIAPTLADVLGVKLPLAQAASLWPEVRKQP